MSAKRSLFDVKIVIDDDCGMYKIGEIWSYPQNEVREYIKRYGQYGYEEMLRFAGSLIYLARDELGRN